MSTTSIRDFWSWFQEREDILFSTDENSDELFDEVSEKLSQVHEDLGFEMTLVPDEHGRREFVISAGGLLAAFDSVCKVVSSAPPLSRWKIIGFKPRKEVEGYLRMEGQQVALDSIFTSVRRFGAYLAVTVFFPEFTEESERIFGEAAFILLDLVLGEADVLKAIGPVEVCALEEADAEKLVPLRDLAEVFDEECQLLAEELGCHAREAGQLFVTPELKARKREQLLSLHCSTVELLDEAVGEELDTCGLRLRYFSRTEFESDTLKERFEAKLPEAQVLCMKAPSLRGDGWITTIDVDYDPRNDGVGQEYLESLIDTGLECNSELDLIQYTDVQLASVVRSLPKLNACLHYHYGELDKAWTILHEAENEHLEDIDFWSLLAYLSAKTGRIERFSVAYQRLEELLEDEEELNEELIGPLWQLACACALLGESRQTCVLVEQILGVADNETAQEIHQELNESEDLKLIRGSSFFKELQSRLGNYH